MNCSSGSGHSSPIMMGDNYCQHGLLLFGPASLTMGEWKKAARLKSMSFIGQSDDL